ncbi:MAG: hypothetical protein J2P37_09655, partial [Ktedonobacteraceae bacterium]|nr:hypothetical protein [Ktedonobacteraceae bacterium]
GGGMTNVLACKLSTRIAAFAVVSGGMHPVAGGCHPARPVPLLEFHGTADRVVPYAGNPYNDDEPPIAQWLAGWAKLDGCRKGPEPFFQHNAMLGERWSACQGDATVIHYRMSGGQHQWPVYNFAQPGHPPLSMTALIWQFFQAHPLPPLEPNPSNATGCARQKEACS